MGADPGPLAQLLQRAGLPTIDRVAQEGEAVDLGAGVFQTAAHVTNQSNATSVHVWQRNPNLPRQFNNYVITSVLNGEVTSVCLKYLS